MRTIVCYIGIVFYLIGTSPCLIWAKHLTKKGKIAEKDAIVWRISTRWANQMMALASMKVDVSGQENIPEGAVVFVSNHQSDFDTLVQIGCLGRSIGFVAKKEIKKIPILSHWMVLMHCVFIDRKNPTMAMKLLLSDSVETLRNGYSLVINPEGTRSRSDQVGKFKYGGFKMARSAGVPIVPIAIDGTYKAWEGNGGWIKPCNVRLRILPPVNMAALNDEQAATIHETVRQMIIHAKDAR